MKSVKLIKLDDIAFSLKRKNSSIVVFRYEGMLAMLFHIAENKINIQE